MALIHENNRYVTYISSLINFLNIRIELFSKILQLQRISLDNVICQFSLIRNSKIVVENLTLNNIRILSAYTTVFNIVLFRYPLVLIQVCHVTMSHSIRNSIIFHIWNLLSLTDLLHTFFMTFVRKSQNVC